MISNITKNAMGTASFDAKFPGMRKAQDFCVYPVKGEGTAQAITIQSDTRIGTICLASGAVRMSKPQSSGAYFHHLAGAAVVATLDAEQVLMLKASVFATASGAAGSRGVSCDNSGAANVFAL